MAVLMPRLRKVYQLCVDIGATSVRLPLSLVQNSPAAQCKLAFRSESKIVLQVHGYIILRMMYLYICSTRGQWFLCIEPMDDCLSP